MTNLIKVYETKYGDSKASLIFTYFRNRFFDDMNNIESIKMISRFEIQIKYYSIPRIDVYEFLEDRKSTMFQDMYNITDEEIKKVNGRRIELLTWLRRIDQYELSKRINVSQSTISRYFRGERTPSTVELTQMALSLECSIDDLIYDPLYLKDIGPYKEVRKEDYN